MLLVRDRRFLGGLVAVSILALCAALPAAADLPPKKDTWKRVETDHFVFLTNGSARQAIRIGKRLEVLREVLTETSAGMSTVSMQPTTIYVFENTKSFDRFNLGEDGKPENVSGYFIRTDEANYVALDASAATLPYEILFHEYLHFFMYHNVPAIPLWLSEGIAELYSTFTVHAGKAEIGRPVMGHLHALTRVPQMPLDKLFAVDTASPEYNEVERQSPFYAQSWLIAHYLMINPDRREQTPRFLSLLGQGVPAVKAFESAYGIDLLTAERELRSYPRTGLGRFVTYDPPEAFEWYDGESTPLDRAETLLHLGRLLANHPPIEIDEVELYLNAAAESPALRSQAMAELAAANVTASRHDRAIELGRASLGDEGGALLSYVSLGDALRAKAVETMPEGLTTLSVPGAELLEARERYRQALAIDEGHIGSLVGLALSYLFDPGDVSEGLAAATRVVAARPARNDVLALQISLLGRSGNTAGARALLDRGLRPRGDADTVTLAEAELARTELIRVERLVRDGEPDEALDVLRALADATHEPELKRGILEASMKFRQAIERIRAPRGPEERFDPRGLDSGKPRAPDLAHGTRAAVTEGELDSIRLYEDGIGLARAGRLSDAIDLLELFLESDAPEELREIARLQLDQFVTTEKRNRHVEAYNEAVALAEQRQFDDARRKLDEVLADEPDEELGREAARLRDRIDQVDRPEKRRKSR